MKKITRRSFLKATGILTAAGILSACGDSSSSVAVGSSSIAAGPVLTDETLVIALNAEPTALTALNGTSTEASLIIAESTGGSLYEYRDGELSPSLASGYDVVDETHYRFHLREGIHYADGTPVTAQDVVYSYNCYAASGNTSATYFNMDELVAEDDSTVMIAFKNYVPGWLGLLAEGSMPIFSQANVDAVGGIEAAERNAPVGCGRYNVSEWKSGEYILIERNENYWDPEYAGYYKYIKFIGIADASSRMLAVQSGDANLAYRISTADYVGLQASPDVDGVIYSETALYNLICNCASEKLKDKKVREALAYATDAAAVNALINMGTGKVAQGLFPESFPYYHEVFEGGHLPYDPEKAKELLAQAGVSNLTLKLPCLAGNKGVATIVQESMRKAGITVEIEICEQSVYVQVARSGEYDLQIGSTDYRMLQPNCFNQFSPDMVGKSIGSIRLADDEALKDMVKRGNSSDEATCTKAMSEIIDYVVGGFCIIGLCTQGKYCAVTSGIEGLITGTRMSYIDVSFMHKV